MNGATPPSDRITLPRARSGATRIAGQRQGRIHLRQSKNRQRIAVVGDSTAVPGLVALLNDPQLPAFARTALEQIPEREAGDALVLRLSGATANPIQLIGVIDSIGMRRVASAISALAVLSCSDNADIAKAAAGKMARIRPPL